MQRPNVLESPVYPNLPESENGSVGSISRDMLDYAWLGGIMDGEGCLQINFSDYKGEEKRHAHVRVEIRNTNPFMIKKISDIYYKMNIPFCYHWVKREKGYKEQMVILVQTYRSVYKLLKVIYPFITAKKFEADLMISFLEWRYSGEIPIGRPNGEGVVLLRKKFQDLYEGLRMAKRIKYSFQRLPRLSSRPLDLSNLEERENVVESSPTAM